MVARKPASPSPFCLSSLTKLILLACLAALPPTLCQDTHGNDTHAIASYDCIDPNNRELTHSVKRGEITTICLYVGPGGDWNSNIDYKRFSVNLIADEFSSYEIPGSFSAIAGKFSFVGDSPASHIFAASQSSLSFLRRYFDKTTERIYPYLTAIIDVQDGIVRGIAWDDACIFCETKMCVPNTYNFDGSLATTEQISQAVNGCYLTVAACVKFAEEGSDICNLKLYTVWTGTDADGKVLLSSDSRFSMFPPNRVQENVKGRYESLVKNYDDFKAKYLGSD